MRSTRWAIAAVALGTGLMAWAAADESSPATPVELGKVRWERDFAAATARATAAKKPLLVLFDEVPG